MLAYLCGVLWINMLCSTIGVGMEGVGGQGVCGSGAGESWEGDVVNELELGPRRVH